MRERGIEPLSANNGLDPKSSASTISATLALIFYYSILTINYFPPMCQGVKERKSQKGELLIRDSARFFNFSVTFRFSVLNV